MPSVVVRKLQQKRDWPFVVGVAILKPLFLLTTKPEWRDGTKLPATGGCVVALNHLSHVDPLTAAHFAYNHGRLPRYLAKSGLFKNKFLSYFLRSAGQIPVERLSRNAVGAYDAAVAAVRAGRVRRGLPRGHHHPRSRPLADDGQVRRRQDRARDGVSGDPGRSVGRAAAAGAVREEARPVPAQEDRDAGRRPGRPERPDPPATDPGGGAGGHGPDHGRHHASWSRRSVGSRRPRSATTSARPA